MNIRKPKLWPGVCVLNAHAIIFVGVLAALSVGIHGPTVAAEPSTKDASLSFYARPQRLVALPGGRRINLDCSGHGSPTVILNPGLNGSAPGWSHVKDALAHRTRVCAWDPPGLGWSDPSPEPQDSAHVAADLAEALKAGEIAGPYVVVGHSAGGYVALLFTDRHRQEVVGMVLVDPSLPDQFVVREGIFNVLADERRAAAMTRAARLRRCAATLRTSGRLGDDCIVYFPEYPDDLVAALHRIDSDPARLETRASIQEQLDASSRLASRPGRDYGALPLIVLTAGKPASLPPNLIDKQAAVTQAWRDGHDQLAALSRRGSNRIVEGSGHLIQLEQPKAVVAAVEEILDQARSR